MSRLLPSSSPHPSITRRENAPPDDARAERPMLLDLSEAPLQELAVGVRDGWPVANGAARIVIDLGERRTLPHDAIEELLVTHRALRRAGGRCALVVGPALAAQLSLANPDGVLWAADRHVAIAALAPRHAPIAAAVTLRPRRRRLHVELSGELDFASLPALEAVLARAHAAARGRREIVFDLTDLAFVDLVALRAITTAVVRCDLADARTRVTGAHTQVRRLVRHLGWQEQLAGIDDAASAPLRTRLTRATTGRPGARQRPGTAAAP